MSYIVPDVGTSIVRRNAAKNASMRVALIAAQGWLEDRDPHEPDVQRDAAVRVAQAHQGAATAERIRDGLRILLGLRGEDAIEATATGLRLAQVDGRLRAVRDDDGRVRYGRGAGR